MQAEGGGGSQVDIGRGSIVKSDSKELPHLASCHRFALRRIAPVLTFRWFARTANINDRADHAIDVNDSCATFNGGARKARGISFTRLESLLCVYAIGIYNNRRSDDDERNDLPQSGVLQ